MNSFVAIPKRQAAHETAPHAAGRIAPELSARRMKPYSVRR